MNIRMCLRRACVIGVAMLATTVASGAMIRHVNLNDLANDAGSIYRGTVLDMQVDSIEFGGGEIPTISYRIRISEYIKRGPQNEDNVVTLRMYGTIKPRAAQDGVQYIGGLKPDLLDIGGEYLLFVTRPSSAGLSTTVGLSQGAFKIMTRDKETVAVNGLNNQGLFRGMDRGRMPESGPINYRELRARIREEIGKRGAGND